MVRPRNDQNETLIYSFIYIYIYIYRASQRHRACLYLQTLWRARHAKAHVTHLRHQYALATSQLQRIIRGFLGRRKAYHLRSCRRLLWCISTFICIHRAIGVLRARVDLTRSLRYSIDISCFLYTIQKRRPRKAMISNPLYTR